MKEMIQVKKFKDVDRMSKFSSIIAPTLLLLLFIICMSIIISSGVLQGIAASLIYFLGLVIVSKMYRYIYCTEVETNGN